MAISYKTAWRDLNSVGPPALTKVIARLLGIPQNGDPVAGGAGAVPNGYFSAEEYGDDVVGRLTVITANAAPISIADDAGVAQYGGFQIYDFPAGLIQTEGAIVTGNLTLGTTGTIIAAYTGVVAIGTATAGTGATLTGTEATILQSTAIGTASAAVSAVAAFPVATALTESGARWINGTATAVDAYLNFAIADDATHTAGTGSFTGTIKIYWRNQGDV